MRYFLCTLLLALTPAVFADEHVDVPEPKYVPCREKPSIIVVIDTGLKLTELSKKAKLCDTGHLDLFKNPKSEQFPGIKDPVPTDEHGHGTNVAGLITQFAGKADYCMVIIRYDYEANGDSVTTSVKGIEHAMKIGAKYINYSGGGISESYRESKAIKAFLDHGGTIIAAAGNEKKSLDESGYYPAETDERVIVVASKPDKEIPWKSLQKNEEDTIEVKNKDGQKMRIHRFSNWGSPVDAWESGYNRVGFGVTMRGTSQATAVYAGKYLNKNECDK